MDYPASPLPSKSAADMEKKWQCESDVRTLTSAAELIADKARVKAALRHIKLTKLGLDKIVGVLSNGTPRNLYREEG